MMLGAITILGSPNCSIQLYRTHLQLGSSRGYWQVIGFLKIIPYNEGGPFLILWQVLKGLWGGVLYFFDVWFR